MKKKILKFSFLSLLVLTLVIMLNVAFVDIFSMPDGFCASLEDIEHANSSDKFGSFIKTVVNKNKSEVGLNNENNASLTFKLFGFIPIKKVDISLIKEGEVYVGGLPLGFAINTDGLIIIGENSIESEKGLEKPKETINLKVGDIITYINGNKVTKVSDAQKVLEDCNGDKIKIIAKRKDEEIVTEVTPILDKTSSQYKLGYWVRNDASGVGTLTFVDKETMKFGALGHAITDFETGAKIEVESGNIYTCNLIGINKGKKGKAGELRCMFLQGKNKKGTIEKNTKCGVFGEVTDSSGIIDENITAKIGGRLSVSPGSAKIVSCVNGMREEYDVEIIKTNYQPRSSDKSFVFRVKDKRLLNLTGGIVQGMSGSPIIQNGKIIGAVTHVFLSDPTKGYGVYSDWMLNELS